MKVTVVTPVLNRARVVRDCLASVAGQTHPDVQHVVVDGASIDGTLEVVRAGLRQGGTILPGPDAGLYDALNKGLATAEGELVGFLGADDVYAAPDALAAVVEAAEATGADAIYGDLLYVRDDLTTVVRTWRSSPFRPGRFLRGWMPPHPTVFIRRDVYRRLGGYDTRFRIAADYELLLRYFECERIKTAYVPRVLVKMRVGGVSNRPGQLLRKSVEDVQALWQNGFRAVAPFAVALKNLRKTEQFLAKSPPARA